MGMSNAERQKRYRDRLKARAAVADGDVADELADLRALHRVMVREYRAAGRALLERYAPDCIEAFEAEEVSPATLATAAQQAGERRALEIQQRWTDDAVKAAAPANDKPAEQAVAPGRRRKAKGGK